MLHGLLICSTCGQRVSIRYRGNGGISPTYECNGQKRQALSKRACLHVSCPPLDNAVSERVLQAVDTDHLALALAAHDELTQRDEAVLKQWQMRLQRAEYDADLAQRRYEQVDAANRLVAASLESRWNESLQRLDEVRRQLTDFQRQQTRTFTPEQREQILALARNLPRLWQAETTSAKDRKRLLRLLLQDITVERGPGREVQLHVRWVGDECEDLTVTLPAKIQDRLRYPPERIEEIRRLATEHTDAEIAEVLNQRGQTSSRGQPFTAKMIAWIRWKYRLPTIVLQRQPNEMTVSEVAAEFGVAKNVVHYWLQRGVLPARQVGTNRPYWITLSEHKEQELRAWVQASKRINRKSHQESSVELSSTSIEGGAL